MILIIVALVITAVLFGSSDISAFTSSDKYILWNLRLPRTVMCLLCGSTLAVCGSVFQAVFRNPLCDPYIIGVSSGASLGATIVIVLGLDTFLFGLTLGAFISSLATVFLIMRLSAVGNRLHTTTLLLAGISINFLFSAIISILMFYDQEDMHKIYFWTMGSLSSITYKDCITVAAFTIVGSTFLILFAKRLNVLLLGDLQTNSLGIDAQKTKKIVLIIATLMCSSVVSICGVIGFVGLVCPHIARLLFGQDNRKILPFSILLGMIFMLLADITARNLFSPSELPIGTVTSIVGAPFFIYLLYNAKKKLHF